jgi:hypothetical protein
MLLLSTHLTMCLALQQTMVKTHSCSRQLNLQASTEHACLDPAGPTTAADSTGVLFATPQGATAGLPVQQNSSM